MGCSSCGSIANVAMTCSLYEWGALSLHTLLRPATSFVRLPLALAEYDLDHLPDFQEFSICSFRRLQAIQNLEEPSKRLPYTRHASAQLGIPLCAGYANRAELGSQKLLQGRHFPSTTENQDFAANGQPIEISTTHGRTMNVPCAVSYRGCELPWASVPSGGLLAGIPLPVSRSLMSVRLHDPLACHSSGSHRPGLRQGPPKAVDWRQERSCCPCAR